jgi:hypothetical protein
MKGLMLMLVGMATLSRSRAASGRYQGDRLPNLYQDAAARGTGPPGESGPPGITHSRLACGPGGSGQPLPRRGSYFEESGCSRHLVSGIFVTEPPK